MVLAFFQSGFRIEQSQIIGIALQQQRVRPPTEAELDYMRRIPFPGAQIKANWGVSAFVS